MVLVGLCVRGEVRRSSRPTQMTVLQGEEFTNFSAALLTYKTSFCHVFPATGLLHDVFLRHK